jgi:N-acetylmuramoyl-L-alanine amidase
MGPAMMPITPESPCASAFLASPNHGERRGRGRPDTIILHYTGMSKSVEALAWLCDPASQVSCHYFVWEDGNIVQLVAEERRAWHAGQSCWQGETDLNSTSIGIEIANPGHDGGLPVFPEAQVAALVALCRDITARLVILPPRVLAHSDIAPSRKRDPGEKFPWARLHRAGIGHYVEPAPIEEAADADLPVEAAYAAGRSGASAIEVGSLQEMLATYGYDVPVNGVYCATTEAVVRAFQRHFRPERVDGIADRSTVTTLRELIRTVPA